MQVIVITETGCVKIFTQPYLHVLTLNNIVKMQNLTKGHFFYNKFGHTVWYIISPNLHEMNYELD